MRSLRLASVLAAVFLASCGGEQTPAEQKIEIARDIASGRGAVAYYLRRLDYFTLDKPRDAHEKVIADRVRAAVSRFVEMCYIAKPRGAKCQNIRKVDIYIATDVNEWGFNFSGLSTMSGVIINARIAKDTRELRDTLWHELGHEWGGLDHDQDPESAMSYSQSFGNEEIRAAVIFERLSGAPATRARCNAVTRYEISTAVPVQGDVHLEIPTVAGPHRVKARELPQLTPGERRLYVAEHPDFGGADIDDVEFAWNVGGFKLRCGGRK